MNAFRLYWRYVGISMRSQMEYRTSFLLLTLAAFIASSADIISIWVLFDRFSNLNNWHFAEVGYLYGMVKLAWSFGDCSARGFDLFGNTVKSGDFDTLLLRPRSTVLQVAGQELRLTRLGTTIQGIVVMLWATQSMDFHWTVQNISLTLFAVFGGACLFLGLFIIQATLAFWTTETLEAMNILTFGGTDTAQYPISIYAPWLRNFFTYIVPMACVTYYPLLTILQKNDPLTTAPLWFGWIAPLAGIVFLVLSLQFWKVGVRRYCSTGS